MPTDALAVAMPRLGGSSWQNSLSRAPLRVSRGLLLALLLVLPTSLRQSRAAEPEFQTEQQRQVAYDALARQESELEARVAPLKQVVRLVRPTVVHIEVMESSEIRIAPIRRGSADETGSGVIIELAGKHYILTNRHLVHLARPENISVNLFDGRRITPTRSWQDQATDIAVLAVDGERLFSSRVGDSDRLEVGDFVLAIGSPFGLSHSVTHGIISAKGRRDLELATDGVSYQDFLQTDASINPGNSGGPLINLRGEVVGINTAIASSSGRNEGIGFSIPINMVMIVARQLIEHGSVTRGFLGVNLDSKFGAEAAAQIGLDHPHGARVTAVSPGSPAEAAGLRIGDVILEFNGVSIQDDSHLVNTVSLTEVGLAVPMVVYRDHKTLHLSVKIMDRAAAGK